MKVVHILGIFFVVVIQTISASKILFVLPLASKSHKNVFDPLIEGLAARNHSITVISPLKTSKYSSVREIAPVPISAFTQVIEDPIAIRKMGKITFLATYNDTNIKLACHEVYKNLEIQKLMKEESFDLIVLNGFGNTCCTGLVGHFQVPYIVMFTMAAPSVSVGKVGNHFPPSFVPSSFFEFTDRMTFLERTANLLLISFFNVLGYYKYELASQEIYWEYLPDAPSIEELDKNISMIFMNSHFTMTYARPLLPNVIEVGGMHCRPAKPVPKDLDEFLSGAEDGFILFSLGSIIQAKTLPNEIRKVFLNVFSRLKQRVIWKWETEEMDDLPPNVKLSKWLPQQDVLGHKNIRLFITHGGLLSTQEAVYHGVPLIGIPIFGDQDLNMKQAENLGFCRTLEILGVTEERLESLIREILEEPQFTQRAKELSTIYRDQPQTSLERAVFWAEYAIRHKGAPHLQSPARDLNFWQYHSLDVIGFLAGVLILFAWTVKFLVCNLGCRLIRRLKKPQPARTERKQKAQKEGKKTK